VSIHRHSSIDSVKIIEVRAGACNRILNMWTELAALRAMDKNRDHFIAAPAMLPRLHCRTAR
jgi:hypothetical protein